MSAQSQTHVTFAAATNIANLDTNSGLPQVSVLTLKKQKEALKKRREALIAGNGRSYRGIGTHRRSTTKHTWTYGELAELTATFITHYNVKPLCKIAEEIHASFAVQLKYQQALDAAQAQAAQAATATAPQEEQVAQLREPRTHLPTVTAIELKLMDCVSLHFNDTHNYISKPSQIHREVWSHLLCAQKHRTMIRSMTAKQPEQEQELKQEQEPAQDPTQDQDREIWNVHAREFMYDTVAEYEAAFPPAKRRKFNPEDTAATTITGEIEMSDGDDNDDNDDCDDCGEMNMSDVCEALEEIATEVETREQGHQQNNAAIALSMAIIRQQQQDIKILLEYMEDTRSGMGLCQQRIDAEMAKIDAILLSGSTNTTTATPNTTTAAQGPMTITANSQFDPNDYKCRECAQMFDPRDGGYWLIGPNRETGDTFYLCHECTKFMDDETPQTPRTPAQRIDQDEESDNDCCGGDCDCWESDDDCDYYTGGNYDHSEECS
jgi:hypothetical protein